MRLGEEIRDPWGLVLGGIAAGLGWAFGIPAPAALAIGAAVYAVKVAGGVTIDRPRSLGSDELPVRGSSPEGAWVRRAEEAVTSLQRLGSSAPPGPVAERCDRVGEQAETVLDDVRRLAGQATAVGDALGRFDVRRLQQEQAMLERTLASRGLDEDIRQETSHSLESVNAQVKVFTRLREAGARILARIQAVVLGLESLVARMVEVLAMARAQSPLEGVHQIDELAEELDALRSGLAETEEVSRRALRAYEGQQQLSDGSAIDESRVSGPKDRGESDAEAT